MSAKNPLIGRTIVDVRGMTKAELGDQCWSGEPCVILTLDDGTVLFPSRDEEGNGPGALFGTDSKGKGFMYGG